MAAITWLDVGDNADMFGRFRDPETRALVDPAAVTCKVSHPDGTTSEPSVTKVSTGVYEASIECDEDGDWAFVMLGTAPHVGAAEGEWKVRPPKVPR